MEERFKSLSAVMLLLTRKKDEHEEILFQKRQNTGYCDGFYDLSASGHVDANESMKHAMCREATHDLYVNHNGKFLLCRLGSEAMDFWDEIDSNDLENLKAKIKVAKLRVSKQCCYVHLKEYL